MSAVTEYFSDVHTRLTELEESQRVTIAATATLGATAICDGRPIHIYDTGHLISHEFIARTGGLAAYTALTFGASLSRENEWVSAHRRPVDPSGGSSARLLVEWLFEQGTIQPKDPLILSSVSGTNALIVELALQAREREVSVIAVTGVDFSSELHSNHGSGKRLFEVADIVLDNRVPYGDSALAIDGLAMPAIAWSGLAGAALMWAVTAGIIERCLAAQTVPTVYTSYNLPGGEETYRTSRETYRMTGR
ncbi:sugar isomerase domain-containing protein [Frigoribacterium sp. CG_9.8]|uniref:sugar isomerase domain-containing protein n=1 Tax=Frigoribacterium sp. CG_9.8 TaxID=2787733 RepID=UPI0018CA7780|nr:sugar isomerase domain-containing protein [Frigoribacterium sp. CG_9.8]MBG6107390.1 putative phosphosugar-binding protein [Frigoribacterium sp. CG_9.8]